MNDENNDRLTEVRSIVFGVNGSPGLVSQIESIKESILSLKSYIDDSMDEHIKLHEKEGEDMAMVKAEKVKLSGVYLAVILGALANIVVALIAALL